MTSPQLLPCQDCGARQDSEGGPRLSQFYDGAHIVSCYVCGARTGTSSTPEAAIAAWNRRAPGWVKAEECPEEWKGDVYMIMADRFGGVVPGNYDRQHGAWVAATGWGFVPSHVMPLPAAPEFAE